MRHFCDQIQKVIIKLKAVSGSRKLPGEGVIIKELFRLKKIKSVLLKSSKFQK